MRILKYRKKDRPRAVNRKRHADNAERMAMPVVRGDQVQVVRGDDKGKRGEVIRVYPKKGRITVKGVNIVKKHRKARSAEEQSGIIEMEATIHVSNVMVLDPSDNKPTRVRVERPDGKRKRIAARTGKDLD